MFSWSRSQASRAFFNAAKLFYRAEVRSRGGSAPNTLHLYDGGDLSPYCMEALIDLVRTEAHASRSELDLTFEVLGRCSSSNLDEVAHRFTSARIPGLHVTLRADGHPSRRIDVGPARQRAPIQPS